MANTISVYVYPYMYSKGRGRGGCNTSFLGQEKKFE